MDFLVALFNFLIVGLVFNLQLLIVHDMHALCLLVLVGQQALPAAQTTVTQGPPKGMVEEEREKVKRITLIRKNARMEKERRRDKRGRPNVHAH